MEVTPGSLFNQGKRLANQLIREIEPCLPQFFDQRSRREHLAIDLRAESQPQRSDEWNAEDLRASAGCVVVEDGQSTRVDDRPG